MNRDLAARNCLVTPDLTVKIGDYGTSIEAFKVSILGEVFNNASKNPFTVLACIYYNPANMQGCNLNTFIFLGKYL